LSQAAALEQRRRDDEDVGSLAAHELCAPKPECDGFRATEQKPVAWKARERFVRPHVVGVAGAPLGGRRGALGADENEREMKDDEQDGRRRCERQPGAR